VSWIHLTDLLLIKQSHILPSTDNELSIRSAGLPGNRDPPQHFVLRALEHAQPPRLAHLLPIALEAYNLVGALVKTTIALGIATAIPAATIANPVAPAACPATSPAACPATSPANIAVNALASPAIPATYAYYKAASVLSPVTIRIISGTLPLACDAPTSTAINTINATAPEAPDGASLSGTPAATSTVTGEAIRAKTLGNQDSSPSLRLRLLIRGR
jgi:hypothetical protein